MSSAVAHDQHRRGAGLDEFLGDTAEQQPSGAAGVVVTADDEIEAMRVRIVAQRLVGGGAVDDLMADVDPRSHCAVGDIVERLLEIAAGGIRRLDPVGGSLGVGT